MLKVVLLKVSSRLNCAAVPDTLHELRVVCCTGWPALPLLNNNKLELPRSSASRYPPARGAVAGPLSECAPPATQLLLEAARVVWPPRRDCPSHCLVLCGYSCASETSPAKLEQLGGCLAGSCSGTEQNVLVARIISSCAKRSCIHRIIFFACSLYFLL